MSHAAGARSLCDIAVVTREDALDVAALELRDHALTGGGEWKILLDDRGQEVETLLLGFIGSVGWSELAHRHSRQNRGTKLSYVARPRVVLEARKEVLRQLTSSTCGRRELHPEVSSKNRDITFAVAK